jgi:DNA-directed RNA polymerase specialized sigma24 family protein
MECIDEGMYSFVLAYRAWDPSRGPFKTYLAGTMAKQFITRLKKENKHFFYDLVKINDELLFASLTADEKYDFEGHLFSFNPNLLSEEAKVVLRLIFSIGDDLRYISKNQIEKYLQKTMKWTRFHIQKTFKEIEEILTE